jgi:aromatic-L-amino-acid decarboxylase
VEAGREAAEEAALSGLDFREDGADALEWAARYLERVNELPVLAQVRPGELAAKLPTSAPEQPEAFAAVLRDLEELLVPALTNWQSPRFFSYFAVTSSEPAILAELLAAALNQVAIVWRASPASTELELCVADWVRQLLGLPEGWHGHIEDTASTCTLAALIAARHVTGRDVVVCSEHAHSSVEKDARMLGMQLRKVPADEELRMRVDGYDLDDVAAVVATVGTTSFASVDPVRELAERAHAAGAWLHVDAAYAGSSWICEEERWSADGVELADSLVVNPHKWLLVPTDCSLVWTARPDEWREAFTLTPEYLRTDDEAFSLADYGPPLGRRFRSLKLWAVLRCYGAEGLRAILREHIKLAEVFAGWVEESEGWELVAPRRFSLVVFRREGSDEENEALESRVNASGEIFITHTKLDGRYVLRLAIGNARTTEDDVRRAWDVLNREAAR